MLGFSANMSKISNICKRKNVPVLEDNCESVGAKLNKKYLGTLGNIGVFSFDFGKNITTGEGGAILTNNKKLFKFCKEYHDHGHELNPKYPRGMDTVKIFGFNYRMTEMQGAVGLAQLKKLKKILSENKKRYEILFKNLKNNFKIRTQFKGTIPSYDTMMFEVRNNNLRSKIIRFLKKKNIGTKNVPDAIKWHFAHYWKHALNREQIKSIQSSRKKLKNILPYLFY